MKSKKSTIIVVIAICVVIVVSAFVIPLVSNFRRQRFIEKYTSEDLNLYSELSVFSDSIEVDGNAYSLAGIKEAVRLGADVVTLDLCFQRDGTPVIIDDYTDITDSTLKAEEVYKLISSDDYSDVKINFRLRQLSSLNEFNRLVNEYGVSKKVYISGIDSKRYTLISGSDTGVSVYFDYIPTDSSEETVNEVTDLMEQYSVAGIVIDCRDLTAELTDAFAEKGIPFIVGATDNESDMYRVMSYGAYAIDTNSPRTLKEAHDSWKSITQDRLNVSILDELNIKN